MRAVDLIRKKRDSGEHSLEEINFLISGYTRGEIPDYQMSAWLMATWIRGLSRREIAALTEAMLHSGEVVRFPEIAGKKVDKHSTGGVGDKTSLILAPIVAAGGLHVPMISGRGLGHTGGTLDKLEAIPGWRARLAPKEFVHLLSTVGCVISAAGDDLAPADRKLYALRDVTGTVESIPLIASSIMSKKIAEGTQALVLDVKVGRGAFMHERDAARDLAETMVRLGTESGVRTTALLTAMDVPLGRAVGNAVEVEESVQVLQGRGPDDLVAVTLALAREMLALAGIEADPAEALADGRALAKYREMIAAQGGDPDADLPAAEHVQLVRAAGSGWLRDLDALGVGIAAWRLGAGRARKEDPVSAGAGVICLAKPGEPVTDGQPLLELRTDEPARFARSLEAVELAIDIGAEPPVIGPPVLERVT